MLMFAALMAVLVVLTVRQPGVAAGLLLCSYGLEQWTQARSTFFFTHGTVNNYVSGGLALLGVVIALVKRKTVFRPMPAEYWAALGLFVWTMMTVMWSKDPKFAWDMFTHSSIFLAIFLFSSLRCWWTDRAGLKAMVYTLLTLGFVICTLLLLTVEWDYRTIKLDSRITFASTELGQGNPLAVASLGGEIALAAFLLNFRGSTIFWLVVRYVVVGVGFAIAVKSGSRGQALALIIAALTFMPFSRRFRDVKGFIGFVFSLAIFGAVVGFLFKSITSTSLDPSRWTFDSFMDAYESGRLETSLFLMGEWVKGGPVRWLAGLGSSSSYGLIGIYPHVVVVEVIAETGLIGFAILCTFGYYNYRSISKLWGHVRDNAQDRGMVAVLGSIYLFEVILSFKQGQLLASGTMFALGIMLARMLKFYESEIALYEQLDAGGYAMSAAERENEFDTYGIDEGEYEGALETAGAR